MKKIIFGRILSSFVATKHWFKLKLKNKSKIINVFFSVEGGGIIKNLLKKRWKSIFFIAAGAGTGADKKTGAGRKKRTCSAALLLTVLFTLERCPLRVRLVLIWILPMGSMVPVAWARVVSQAAFLPSLMAFLRCSASWRNCSSSFMAAVVAGGGGGEGRWCCWHAWLSVCPGDQPSPISRRLGQVSPPACSPLHQVSHSEDP